MSGRGLKVSNCERTAFAIAAEVVKNFDNLESLKFKKNGDEDVDTKSRLMFYDNELRPQCGRN